MTWHDFQETFGSNHHRKAIIAITRARLELIADRSIPIHSIWINGSYVTAKERPQDIDVVVFIDGLALHDSRPDDVSPAEYLERIESLPRYEDGKTAVDHLTDFHYVVYYPPGSAFGAYTERELSHWFTVWSRLEIDSPSGRAQGKMVDDGKGFVEVRWPL